MYQEREKRGKFEMFIVKNSSEIYHTLLASSKLRLLIIKNGRREFDDKKVENY